MKNVRILAVFLAVTMVLLSCTPPAAKPAATTEKAPIKIGFLSPISSISAESAKDMTAGFMMWWDEYGLEVAGHKVEIYEEDDTGDPDVALTKARLLVEQRKVDMLVGLLFANTGLSVSQYVKEIGIPAFYPVISADDITQRGKVDTLIRIGGWTSSQVHHPFGEWVYDNTPCRKCLTIGSDYAFGHECVGGFSQTFTEKGGTIVKQLWHPVAEADFSSYMATIKAEAPDCVFSLSTGTAAVRFLQAYYEFGLKDTIPLYAGEVLTDASIIRGVNPPEAALGITSAGHYAEGRNSPDTQKFVTKFEQKYGKIPSYYAVATYVGGQWITKALEMVNGDVSDRAAFLKAIRSVEFSDTPFGPEKLDAYDNPIFNVYIRETVKRADGKVWNIVKDTIPSVSQFWKYDPVEYLKQPVYSRDFQGIKK